MPITELDHYFVRARNIERSRTFYCEALGFEVMPRPVLPFPGYWLGVGGKIQVHMGPDDFPEGQAYYLGTSAGSARDNAGVVDHIAFQCTDAQGMAQRLAELGLPMRTRHIAEISLFQIFVADPDGLMIELNFPGVQVAPVGPSSCAMNPVIRQETPSDVAAIHAVTMAAFRDAPHTAHTEQFIVDALRKAGALAISLVAEQAGQVVGHVAVSPVSISDGSAGWHGLGPISVSPNLQGRGIGSLLMEAALRLLRERRAAGCVLVGDPVYYSRFGFKPESSLELPDVPPEYFQALPFGKSLPNGVVKFHEAFGARG